MKSIIKKVLIVSIAIGMVIANVGTYAVTGNELNDDKVPDASVLQTGYNGRLTTSVEMRILPSINSSVIATISENTEFNVIDIMNKWCYIETENQIGWVLLSKLGGTNPAENNNPVPQEQNQTENENTTTDENTTNESETTETTTMNVTKYVSVDTLNVRESADNNAKIIDQVSLNDEVVVTEEIEGSWSKISYNGKTGYVASRYLSTSKTAVTSRSETSSRRTATKTTNYEVQETYEPIATSTATSEFGNSVVSYAKQYLGYRYVSGGSSPSTGFDCSGFTSYVYSHFGVSLNRTTSGQNSNGTYVDRSNLQPGDILVFRNRSNTSIGHVGIYVGGNSFIHAENSSTGVCMGSISSSYYSTRYVGARRVI